MRPADAIAMHTGYALFDRNDALIDANAEILCGGLMPGDLAPRTAWSSWSARVLEQLRSFDGKRSSGAAFRRSGGSAGPGRGRAGRSRDARRRWKTVDRASAHRRRRGAGQRRHHRDQARPDRTSRKRRDLPLHHRQPPAARSGWSTRKPRRSSTRAWTPPICSAANGGRTSAQFITDHAVDADEFDQISALLARNAIVHDHEMQLRRANGATIWCSTNCRRGAYRGRPVADHRRARHHRAQAARGSVRLPDQAPSASGLDERRHHRRGHPPERCGQAAVRLGRQARTAHPLARRLFRRPRTISGDQPRTDRATTASKIARRCCGAPTDSEFWATGNLRTVEFHGPQGGAGRHRRRDQAEAAGRRGGAGARDACQRRRSRCPKGSRSTTTSTGW